MHEGRGEMGEMTVKEGTCSRSNRWWGENHDPVPKFYKSFHGHNYYAYAYYMATKWLV